MRQKKNLINGNKTLDILKVTKFFKSYKEKIQLIILDKQLIS